MTKSPVKREVSSQEDLERQPENRPEKKLASR